MTTTTQAPAVPATFAEMLDQPNRPGWGGWQSVGGSVYEGVQNWSERGDERGAVGVWGNVIPYPGHGQDEVEIDPVTFELTTTPEPERVNWCVYVGDCRDPHREGFETAEDAMIYAEREFPGMFAPEAA